MKCLFLGYDENKTKLIRLLTQNGCKVTHKSSQILPEDIKKK